MTRTFHNAPGAFFPLAATLIIAVGGYFLWMRMAIIGAALLLLAIVFIERTIHTQYTIDDERLIIRRGRLSSDTAIPLDQVATANVFRPAPWLLLIPRGPIVIVILKAKPRPLLLTPSNPDEFVKVLKTRVAK